MEWQDLMYILTESLWILCWKETEKGKGGRREISQEMTEIFWARDNSGIK